MAKSFAERQSEALLMADAVKKNSELLKGVSLTEVQAKEMEAEVAALNELNSRQEKLKADLKTCTQEISARGKKLDGLMLDAKKRIKLAVLPSQWKEFGITDKK